MTLRASELAFFDVRSHKFMVEPGDFNLLVGSSSEDIRLRSHVVVQDQAQ
jgi:beta-glucosidase